MTNAKPKHFQGKGALGHVAEAQAKGIVSASEIHGTELPGHLSAAADSARETATALLLMWTLLSHLSLSFDKTLILLFTFSAGWTVWRIGRSAWLAWARLERLHRIVAQEKYEIEHHRQQERDELRVLYAAKGFEGKLLEDVLDVLMADGDRLLKVMVEEELGLTLEIHEHPLKQALGAGIGSVLASAIAIFAYFLLPQVGIILGSLAVIGLSAGFAAYLEQNKRIPAIIWNMAIGTLAFGITYFLLDYFISRG